MTTNTPHILYGDPEHERLRLVLPLIFIAEFLLIYFVMIWGLPFLFGGAWTQFILLGVCLAVPLSVGLLMLTDPLIRKFWPSGVELQLTEERFVLTRPGKTTITLDRQKPSVVTRWGFEFKPYARFGRERQIAHGWFCYAVQITQEGERVIFHTYVSPTQAAEFEAQMAFKQLDMGQIYDLSLGRRIQEFRAPSGRAEIPAHLTTGETGRYWLAERNRWTDGVEFAPADFLHILNTTKNLPKSPIFD